MILEKSNLLQFLYYVKSLRERAPWSSSVETLGQAWQLWTCLHHHATQYLHCTLDMGKQVDPGFLLNSATSSHLYSKVVHKGRRLPGYLKIAAVECEYVKSSLLVLYSFYYSQYLFQFNKVIA